MVVPSQVNRAVSAAQQPTPSSVEPVSAAVRLLALFARPTAQMDGVGTVVLHLDQLCEYVATYLNPSELRYYAAGRYSTADHTTRQVPSFLRSFAQLLSAIPYAPDRTVATVASLLHQLFTGIDTLPGLEAHSTFYRQAALAVQVRARARRLVCDAVVSIGVFPDGPSSYGVPRASSCERVAGRCQLYSHVALAPCEHR